MTKEDAVKYIRYCMCEGRLVGNTKPIIDEKWQAGVMAIEALEQQPCPTCKYGVLGKIANFFQNWDCDENAKLEISVRDMREISSMFATKCRAESKLKVLEQHNIDKLISKLEDEKFKLCNDDIHCGFDGGLERAKQIVKEFYEATK